MDIGSQKILEIILGKSMGHLTDMDIDFLLARRSYVADKDFERLGIDVTAEIAKRANPSAPQAETPTVAPVEKKKVSQMNKTELLAEAAALGVVVPEGSTNDAIRALLA